MGTFVAADPILDTSDSRQVNGYVYANANPVTFSDPSGLAPMALSHDDKRSAGEMVAEYGTYNAGYTEQQLQAMARQGSSVGPTDYSSDGSAGSPKGGQLSWTAVFGAELTFLDRLRSVLDPSGRHSADLAQQAGAARAWTARQADEGLDAWGKVLADRFGGAIKVAGFAGTAWSTYSNYRDYGSDPRNSPTSAGLMTGARLVVDGAGATAGAALCGPESAGFASAACASIGVAIAEPVGAVAVDYFADSIRYVGDLVDRAWAWIG